MSSLSWRHHQRAFLCYLFLGSSVSFGVDGRLAVSNIKRRTYQGALIAYFYISPSGTELLEGEMFAHLFPSNLSTVLYSPVNVLCAGHTQYVSQWSMCLQIIVLCDRTDNTIVPNMPQLERREFFINDLILLVLYLMLLSCPWPFTQLRSVPLTEWQVYSLKLLKKHRHHLLKCIILRILLLIQVCEAHLKEYWLPQRST